MKSETKFTPGPWLTFGPLITADDKLAPGYTLEICHMGTLADNVKHPKNEAEGNAALIAAAPDMFEALEMIATDLENGVGNPRTMAELARAALAKASGRERGEGV